MFVEGLFVSLVPRWAFWLPEPFQFWFWPQMLFKFPFDFVMLCWLFLICEHIRTVLPSFFKWLHLSFWHGSLRVYLLKTREQKTINQMKMLMPYYSKFYQFLPVVSGKVGGNKSKTIKIIQVLFFFFNFTPELFLNEVQSTFYFWKKAASI